MTSQIGPAELRYTLPAACDGSVNRQHQHQDASRHCGQESGHQQDHQTNSNSTEDIPLLRRLLHRELPRPVGVAVIYLPWRIQRGQICVELPVPDHSKVCSRLLLHRILHGLPDLQHSGPSGCQEMEPVVRHALASSLHSLQNLPHRLLHLRDSIQTLQLRSDLPPVSDDDGHVRSETHAEGLLCLGTQPTCRE